jgi:hypothetical protein
VLKNITIVLLCFIFTSCSSNIRRYNPLELFFKAFFGIKEWKPISETKLLKGIDTHGYSDYQHFVLKSEGLDSLIRGVKRYNPMTIHIFDNQGNLLTPNFEKPFGCSPMISFKEIYFSHDSLSKSYFNYEFDTRKYINNTDTISILDIVKYLYTIDGNKVDSIKLHPNKTILVSWARWAGRYNKRIKRQFLDPLKDVPKNEYDIYLINFDLHKKFDKGFRFDWI